MRLKDYSAYLLGQKKQLYRANFYHLNLIGLGAVLVAGSVAGPTQAGDLELSYGVSVTEILSDNIDLDPDGAENTGSITDVKGDFRLRSTSARVTGNYDLSATLRYQNGGEDEGYSLIPNLRGAGNIEAIEDLFFVDTSSSVSRQVLNSRASDTESNRETVQTHRVSPYLVNRFGDFASSELRYTFAQTITDSDSTSATGDDRVSDTTTQTLRYALNSGNDFSRLRWGLDASTSVSDRSNDQEVTRSSANFSTEYAIERSFSVIGSAGYERLEEDENPADAGFDTGNDFSGVTWRTGFRWRPSRRTELEAGYGRSDNDESFDAQLSQQIGGQTQLTASYDESLETGNERLERNVSQIGTDPLTGELIDLTTGLPFDPNTGPTSVVRDFRRTKRFRADVNGTRGRDSFSVGTTFITQERESRTLNTEKETGIGLSGSWSRRLNSQTNFRLRGTFLNTEFDDENREDREYSLTAGVDRNVFSNVNAFANYIYRRQDSDSTADEYVENRLWFGARANF